MVRVEGQTPALIQEAINKLEQQPDPNNLQATTVMVEEVKLMDSEEADMDGGPVIYFP